MKLNTRFFPPSDEREKISTELKTVLCGCIPSYLHMQAKEKDKIVKIAKPTKGKLHGLIVAFGHMNERRKKKRFETVLMKYRVVICIHRM